MKHSLLLCATLLFALPALAGEEDRRPDPAQRLLDRLDQDGDGKIARAEMPERAPFDFEKADADGDGFLTAQELKKSLKRRDRDPRKMLERLDKDGDGKLSAAEIPERAPFQLDRADANGDGFVDAKELGAMMKRGRGGERDFAKMLKKLDADGDGAITRAEWKGPQQRFERLDQDGDGVISAAEIEKIAQRVRGAKGGAGDALFRRADKDGDGRVSKEEWPLDPAFFARFDMNQDGFVTRDEVTPMRRRRDRGAVNSGRDSAHFLDDHDKNGDGAVDRLEFPHKRRFDEIDADGDGLLSKSEIEEAMDKRERESDFDLFDRFDLDGDGKITREEFTGPARIFERKDTNHDGVIDAADTAKDE